MSAAPAERIDAGPVELVRVRADHLDELTEVIAASVGRLALWMHWAVDWTPARQPAFLESVDRLWTSRQEFTWLVLHGGAIVGGAAFERRGDVCEIGYWLADGSTGQGFATEATRALTSAAFGLAGVARTEIWHDAANEPSGGIPRRLGYREVERRDPSRLPPIGRRVGIDVVHEMRREDWRP